VLYGVPEEYILWNWSIETIRRKLKNGIDFDLYRRGFSARDEKDEPLNREEEAELFEVYLNGSNGA
jgi:hypothetical protein